MPKISANHYELNNFDVKIIFLAKQAGKGLNETIV